MTGRFRLRPHVYIVVCKLRSVIDRRGLLLSYYLLISVAICLLSVVTIKPVSYQSISIAYYSSTTTSAVGILRATSVRVRSGDDGYWWWWRRESSDWCCGACFGVSYEAGIPLVGR